MNNYGGVSDDVTESRDKRTAGQKAHALPLPFYGLHALALANSLCLGLLLVLFRYSEKLCIIQLHKSLGDSD